MFDVGFTELLLVFVIGLLILGPERLPRVAAQLGRWVARARRTANQLRYQLEREVALDEIYKAQKKKPQKRPGATAPGTGAADAPGEPPRTAGEAEGSAGEASAEASSAAASTEKSTVAASAEGSTVEASVAGSPDPSAARAADSSRPSPAASEQLEAATEEAVENVGDDDGPSRQSESSR